jgi:hypothetical protein
VKPLIRCHDTVLGTHRAVERTFAWLTAHRCLARDYERDPALSEAMIRWAAINTMTRAPLSRDRRCSHDRLVLPDRRLPLRHGQVLHPGTAPTIRGHTSRDINGGSLTFTRPAFPWPVTPGWDGGPWAVPRASHPAVTHEVCQGGDEP